MPPPGFPADHPRRLLAELGLSPSKRRGQNFLHDGNIARKIVALSRKMGPPFLEIGAGLGALTGLLAAEGGMTVAVEIDRALARYLRNRFGGSTVEVVEGDFLSVPDAGWRKRFPGGGTAVGNLPYALSSPILLRLMELREVFPRAVLMLQKEVVERVCAPPGGKEYGTLSVYLSILADARREFVVRRTCFTPSPEVDSAVFSIRFRPGIPDPLVRNLQSVVRAAFARRRKRLRNAPVPFLPGGTQQWCDLLAGAGIDPSARAETVLPEKYLLLAKAAIPERNTD
ncbi:MAG TPA: 16S rRNA (adenine(1518)-N(6)/adenine(1519)-N(6))-dimethyltransferase RsmA [Candidatus Limnocylindria bacterium]|nr:16S rRNA (adenine(1518)-N(6)/adenine(1519)-N(6))-dimethyltransferase RsmA [Candidatus Limnocylindria bacterium]